MLEKMQKEQEKSKAGKSKGAVDKEFFRRLKILVKIAIPTIKSKECLYLLLITILLVLRTYMSIWLADVNGNVVKAIIDRSLGEFIKRIFVLGLFSIPASAVNSGIEYFHKLISLAIRTKMTHYFNQRYMQSMFYYKICNLDNRIANPDQRLTDDLNKWSTNVALLYLNFTKPFLDIVLFSRRLSEVVGWEGPALLLWWFFLTGLCMRFISPSFGKLVAVEQKLEGSFRASHASVLNHAEEIAFYDGHQWEKVLVNKRYDLLQKHIRDVIGKRFIMGILDSMLTKYGAVMVGYSVLALPVFGRGAEDYVKGTEGD